MRASLNYLIKLVSLSFFIAAVILVPLCWLFYQHYLDQPLDIQEEGLTFTVPENSNLYAVSRELALAGYLEYPKLLVWHARWKEQAGIKIGEYHFPENTTPRLLLEKLNTGVVVQYSQTFIEGWTVRDMLDALHQDSRVDARLIGQSDNEIINTLGLDITHLEGWFYPDTYLFARGTTDIAILKQAHERMQDILNEEWVARDTGLPFDTAYEALILASIVEKETGAEHERPEIAGVFVRRLQKGMRLQTDPTIIYGLGPDFDGNLTRRHLTEDGPFNTYRINGLPPTPIAAPGREAIEAVLHPAPGDTLYFVARGDGTHQFSATLEEHNAAVQQFQIRQRAENYRSSPAP